MTKPFWDVQEEGTWYRVTARATCPRCDEPLEDSSLRRKAAGPPETPRLEVRVADDGTVELVGERLFLPILTHRCSS